MGRRATSTAQRLFAVLYDGLSRALEGFTVSMDPCLTGYIASGGSDGHSPGGGASEELVPHTMTMQAVRHGLRAVQLELSLRLRKRLRYDHALRARFGAALLDAAASD